MTMLYSQTDPSELKEGLIDMCGHDSEHCRGRQSPECSCAGSRVERFIEPCLLLLLLEKPAHGYDLISRLKELGFSDNPDPGMVYRNLRRLEEQGMITSRWDTSGAGPARRFYEVTREGKELLAAWVEVINLNVESLKLFLERYRSLEDR